MYNSLIKLILNTAVRFGETVPRNSWTDCYDYRNAAPE